MTHPIVTTVTIVAGVSNGIAQSQSLGSAGALTLNGSLVSGGVATLDTPRRIIITSQGNDSGITWMIVGTGRPATASSVAPALTETITGGASAGAPAQTTQDFLTVTSITGSAATASTVTAGTNGVASGPWVPWNTTPNLTPSISAVARVLSGTFAYGGSTYQVDLTEDDVYGLYLPSGQTWANPYTPDLLNGLSAAVWSGALPTLPMKASRLTLNMAGNVAGSVQLTQIQQGN